MTTNPRQAAPTSDIDAQAAPAGRHDVRAVPGARNGAGWRYSAYCATHDCHTTETFPSEDDARAGLVCDSGAGERFIADDGGTTPPRMLDLTGLRRTLIAHVETRTYGWGSDQTQLLVWRWHRGGRAEPLMIRCAQPAGEFDENNWAHTVWVVESHNGTTHLAATVQIDGTATQGGEAR